MKDKQKEIHVYLNGNVYSLEVELSKRTEGKNTQNMVDRHQENVSGGVMDAEHGRQTLRKCVRWCDGRRTWSTDIKEMCHVV